MSVLQYPEAMNASDLQIWDNAAFDNGGESEDSSTIRPSLCPIKSVIVNRSGSLDSTLSKENQSPVPLHPNGAIGNSIKKPIKPLAKQGLVEKMVTKSGSQEFLRDEKKIDDEIEEIEKEITRLSSRLQVLKMEKADQTVKRSERRGRVVPAKFLEQKPIFKNSEEPKKSEENLSAKSKTQRRGVSMGPGEILSGTRRGLSLGPSDILAGVKSRQQLGKMEITPVQSIQSRRKSCFWKLQDIEEEAASKERGKSASLSPKSRKALCKTQGPRQAVTTVGSRKGLKKDDAVLASIQPKKLFRDGEKSVAAAKKPVKPGRVIASRYNQSTIQSALRKRSLPENDKDESKRCDKKRASSVGKSRGNLPEMSQNQGTESRVKKRWEVPSEIVVCGNLEAEKSPLAISQVPEMLPRIRTSRYAIDTPRDSGPAKRVAELVGKKSYFCNGEEVEPSVCQVLSFAEEEEVEEE